jgi:hypothetical protein
MYTMKGPTIGDADARQSLELAVTVAVPNIKIYHSIAQSNSQSE